MRVITNTAISLDGRISLDLPTHHQLGSEADRQQMDVIRATADAIVVGGQTFRNWPHPLIEAHSQRTKPIINAIVTRTLPSSWDEVSGHPLVDRLFFCPFQSIPQGFPFKVVFMDDKAMPLEVLNYLKSLGVSVTLLEGGGRLIDAFLQQDQIDDMYLTLCPKIIGKKGSPALVDGLGFGPHAVKKAVLVSSRVVGDEIFLHYTLCR